MSNETKAALVKRLKSFGWRSLTVFLLGLVSFISGLLPELNLPEISVVFIGLILNEVTKFLNNHTDLFGGRIK